MTYRARCIGKRTTQRTKAQRRAAAEPLTLGGVSEIMKRIWHPEGPVKWAQAWVYEHAEHQATGVRVVVFDVSEERAEDGYDAGHDDGVADGGERERLRIVAWLRYHEWPGNLPFPGMLAEMIARGDHYREL